MEGFIPVKHKQLRKCWGEESTKRGGGGGGGGGRMLILYHSLFITMV